MKTKFQANLGDFHMGKIIKEYIDRRKVSKAALARKIKRSDSTILEYQKSATLQVGIVLELSHALKHNFFADVAALLPATYGTSVPTDTTKDERIAQLELEVTVLKAEKAILLEAIKGN